MSESGAPARRAKVLLVGRGAPEQGGIAVSLDGLLHGPLAEHVDVSLLNLTPDDQAGPGGTFTLSNARRTLRDGWLVFRGSGRADLVHIHSSLGATSTTARAGWLAWCAGRRAPVLLHAHGGRVIDWLDARWARFVLRFATKPFDEIVAVSEAVAAALRPVVGCPVTFVPNGIDLVPFHERPPIPHTTPRVLYVGHLSRRKGLVDLRDASRLLHARGIDHEILVAGGVPDEGAAEGALVEREIGEAMTFLGRVDHSDIPELLSTVTLFCLPSWWEAMPLSVMEAMAAGRATVVTDVGDVARMVEDGVTGVLVPPRDPSALADALQSLLRDPERCEAYGSAGRRRAEEMFDINDTTERLLDRYRALIVGLESSAA